MLNLKKCSKHVFRPRETPQHPYDVTLVVDGGEVEFKAHRQTLSVASPFFQKLQDSDMKEAKEGIVRLEMFSEAVMVTALDFIYTGNGLICTLEIAEGLIVMIFCFFQNSKLLLRGLQ